MTRSSLTRRVTRSGKPLGAALLAGTMLTTAAWAQSGGGPLVPPAPSAGMPAGGMPTGGMPLGGGPGRNPFGAGRLPFASGKVTAVDAAAGTVTLVPMFGGGTPQTVRVTGETRITATREGTVGDLKVGDTIQVRGVPTGITAAQITAEDGADMRGGGMEVTASEPRPGMGQAGRGGPQRLPARTASAQATGTITSLSPLTVTVADGVQVTLRVGPEVKVSRNVSEKIGDLKVGDRVLASGRAGDDGVLTATRMRVNPNYSSYSMGFGLGMR